MNSISVLSYISNYTARFKYIENVERTGLGELIKRLCANILEQCALRYFRKMKIDICRISFRWYVCEFGFEFNDFSMGEENVVFSSVEKLCGCSIREK